MQSSVLITGASRGLGLELVRQYAAEKWQVHATCRNLASATELQRLAANAPNVELSALDVADDAAIESLRKQFVHRPLDILINNAGIDGQMRGEFGSTNVTAWLETLRVNVIAPMKIMEALVEAVSLGERKLMVAISSRLGSNALNVTGASYVYRSSKAALNSVVKSASLDLASRKITVIAVHPGWVRTDMGGAEAPLSPIESVAALRQLFNRLTPEDSGQFLNYDGTSLPW